MRFSDAISTVLDTCEALVAGLRADFIHHRIFFFDESGKFSKNSRAVPFHKCRSPH